MTCTDICRFLIAGCRHSEMRLNWPYSSAEPSLPLTIPDQLATIWTNYNWVANSITTAKRQCDVVPRFLHWERIRTPWTCVPGRGTGVSTRGTLRQGQERQKEIAKSLINNPFPLLQLPGPHRVVPHFSSFPWSLVFLASWRPFGVGRNAATRGGGFLCGCNVASAGVIGP